MDFTKNIKQLSCESEWPVWKRKIRDLLDYHEGALDVIDKKLTKPEPLEIGATEAEKKTYKEKNDLYRKANSYAKTMIASSVTDCVYQKIMDKEKAHEAWEALKLQFEATSKDQLFKVCTEFFAFNWNQNEDVSTHIAKLRSLWNELNNGLKAKEESALPNLILVCKVLHILPKRFETFRSSWMLLTKDEEKTFDELTTQLCMFERNLRNTRNNYESDRFSQEALVAKEDRRGGQANSSGKKWSDSCNYCKKKGHWVRDCEKWKANGKPRKAQSNTVDTNVALISICNEICKIESTSSEWWIDNGATRHVTNRSDLFVEFREFKTPSGIKAAGKETLKALGHGTIEVLSKVDDKILKLTLKNVWYVPEISKNLFSVLAAQDTNPKSQFKSTTTKCWLEVEGKQVLTGVREVYGTLYKAFINPIIPEQVIDVNVVEEDSLKLQIYHERWGHQDKRHVKDMLERELGIKVKLNREICEPCIYGKAHRLPFGTRKKAKEAGELMSTDVCGPFDLSFSKKRYLVVFKDSYTKFRYGYIVKEKSEVKVVLIQMLAHTRTQGHQIKELLCDNGGEFDNKEVAKILQEHGITQRMTAPYTPEQNGNTERENRTIVEMARTFKYSNLDAQFPPAIWAELVNSAIYILNRTGKSSEKGISPFELWMGKKPRIHHLRIIGSICYIHVPNQKRRKMDQKAVKGYLVGYDGDERYRIFFKEENKVVLSRDVIFQEKTQECKEKMRLPFQDIDQQEKEVSQSSDEEKIEDEYEHEVGSEIEDNVENYQPTEEKCLRDRSKLEKPKHFNDYVMAAEEFVTGRNIPETFEDAFKSNQSNEWMKAIEREIVSLEENQTWKKTVLPKGAKAIPCKWVFRLKTNPDGSIEKYKARLVVKGFRQRCGIDYNQTFSPVARMATVRSMLSISASEKMHLTQFDVSTAFLYGKLEEVIYMKQPEGCDDGTDNVCELKRSLYGLKQAPRCWNKRFGTFLSSLGFVVSEADPCLYIQEQNNKILILVLYVDDGLVGATDPKDLETFLEKLKLEFKIVSKKAEYYLGLEILQENGRIEINQKAYARKILERFNFSGCNPKSTPMLKSTESVESRKEDVKNCNFPYRQAVGALMYLMLGTRPDLAYSVGFLSRSLENPSTEDVNRVKRVFRYIAGTLDFGIHYNCNKNARILECFSDADFGGCTKTGRSTSGVIVMYAGGVISWLSQRQVIVATSTTEAEIIAANEATKEIIWLKRLFQEIVKLKEVPVLQVDNSAAVRLAQNPEFHRRTKHIAIKHFFYKRKSD